MLYIYQYSDKSIVLRGETPDATRERREEIKKLGGKYNPNLLSENRVDKKPGWIFKIKDKEKIQSYIDKINQEIIKKEDILDDFIITHPRNNDNVENKQINNLENSYNIELVNTLYNRQVFEYIFSCLMIIVCIFLIIYIHINLCNICPDNNCLVKYCDLS